MRQAIPPLMFNSRAWAVFVLSVVTAKSEDLLSSTVSVDADGIDLRLPLARKSSTRKQVFRREPLARDGGAEYFGADSATRHAQRTSFSGYSSESSTQFISEWSAHLDEAGLSASVARSMDAGAVATHQSAQSTAPASVWNPPEGIINVTNVGAGGPQLPIGNALQFLMNALIFAEVTGHKTVAVGGKVNKTLSPLFDFKNGLITIDGGHLNSSKMFTDCGDLSGSNWNACRVPLKMRRAVALRYLTPRLRPKRCVRDNIGESTVAVHLRSNEWCCDNPMYVQPPCALYDEILKHGNSGKSFGDARIYGDSMARAVNSSAQGSPKWGNPCLKDLLGRSKAPEVGNARIISSSGSLLEDACDLISASNVVLASSTFTSNIVLLNPRRPRLFVPLPSTGFPYCINKYYGRLSGNQDIGPSESSVDKFMEEVREVFPGSVGYQLPIEYMKAAKIKAGGEMLARDNFLKLYGWRRVS